LAVSAGSATWTTSGTGTFGSANQSLNDIYTKLLPIYSGTVNSLHSQQNNPADHVRLVSDFLILTIVRAPLVNAGADATLARVLPLLSADATASIMYR
jgi:hypothetical protein